jgi:hypothetical protein
MFKMQLRSRLSQEDYIYAFSTKNLFNIPERYSVLHRSDDILMGLRHNAFIGHFYGQQTFM